MWERFSGDGWKFCIRRGVARDKEEEGAFVVRSIEDLVEEFHGTGGVGECCEAGEVQGCDEDSGGEADGFGGVVVLDAVVLFVDVPALFEDGDECGSSLQERFLCVGAEGFECVEPLVGGAA